MFSYERVRISSKLTSEEISTISLSSREGFFGDDFPGPAPRVVPSDPDDYPVVNTAVIGRAHVLCTLNRDFSAPRS